MSKFAIVILYEGEKPSVRAMDAFHSTLCSSSIVHDIESIEMYDMSEKEIVASIAARPFCTSKTAEQVKSTPEQEAVITISKRFGQAILDRNPWELYRQMYDAAYKSVHTEADETLNRAIIILASRNVLASLSFDNENDVKTWKEVIEVIRKIYKNVYNV